MLENKKKLDEIKSKKDNWEQELLTPALEKVGPKRQQGVVGIGHLEDPVKEIYTPLDLEEIDFDYLKDVGFPGEYPFVRGSEPTKDPGNPWINRVYAGSGTPEDSNKRFKFLLKEGAEEIVVAADLPTQIGYDADHSMSVGEVGTVGVSLSTLRDWEILFDGIPLNSMKRVGILGNTIGPIAFAFFIALGEKQGLSPDEYVVHLQNDALKEYGARNTQFIPIRPAVRLATDVVRYCAEKRMNWNAINACAAHYGGAGTTAAHAFAFAAAITYIDYIVDKGLHIDDFAYLFNIFTIGETTFTGVSVIRAVRKIWARMMKERYGAKDPRSMAIKMTAYTVAEASAQQPLNNIVRIALGTQTYALAGVDYIFNASYDEGLSIPTEEAARVCIRTQQILAKETEIPFVIDPFAGSYFVESLTAKLEKDILHYLEEIEEMGGAIDAIEGGYFQKKVVEQGMNRTIGYATGDKPHVGVNCHAVDQEPQIPLFTQDSGVAKKRLESIKKIKQERDNTKVTQCLNKVRQVAQTDENIVPAVLDAVRAYATLGEICDVWRDVFGTFEFTKSYSI
ncbi:MAG: methylmalonyl-CoA mutase [Desulfobacteraceae bacterium]|nr:methylmalonyl-CoA mutase [Desulfobacteraceae bacterium]MBC2756245.1 methylmalonyl-CoA mutase [Desulfobacteraceae bacterium]